MATIAERVAILETKVANLIALAQDIRDRFQEFKTQREKRDELEARENEVARRKAKRREKQR